MGHSHLTYRSCARFEESEFLNDLNNASFDNVYNHTDPDEALATWYSVFLKVLDKHAPQKKRRIKYSFKPGWLTLEVLDAMRYRDYLLKLKLFDEYKKQNKQQQQQQRKKESHLHDPRLKNNNFFADIQTNSKNSKDTWRAIDLLINKHAPANTSTTSEISPYDLNKHF